MKKKYILNEQAQFVGYDLVDDDYTAKNDLETCVPMPDGLYEPQTFDLTTLTWSGATYEEWLANQKVEPAQPSQTQQQLAQLTYQQMMTTQDVTTLQTQNAQMAYQLMMMQQQGGEA